MDDRFLKKLFDRNSELLAERKEMLDEIRFQRLALEASAAQVSNLLARIAELELEHARAVDV